MLPNPLNHASMVLREPTDFSAESSTTHHTYEAGHQDIQAHTRFALENTPNTPLPMVHPTQLGQPESIAPNVLNSINTAPMMFYTPTQVGQYGLMAPNAPDLNNMAPIMSYAPTQAQQPEYMAPSAHNFDITSHPTFQFHVPTQAPTYAAPYFGSVPSSNPPVFQQNMLMQNNSLNEVNGEQHGSDERPRKRTKKVKDPKRVGKPNSFMCYRRAHSQQVRAEIPGITNGQISSVLATRWHALSDAEQQQWKDQAARLASGQDQLASLSSPQPEAGRQQASEPEPQQPQEQQLATQHAQEVPNNLSIAGAVAGENTLNPNAFINYVVAEDIFGLNAENTPIDQNIFATNFDDNANAQGAKEPPGVERDVENVSGADPVDSNLPSQFITEGLDLDQDIFSDLALDLNDLGGNLSGQNDDNWNFDLGGN
ncbi:hypothetical protein F4824DRAFT_496166 [Ustulina deusta]|nr:hypothetical protein F4824DRAFT_496166 [Ustulina deusta]